MRWSARCHVYGRESGGRAPSAPPCLYRCSCVGIIPSRGTSTGGGRCHSNFDRVFCVERATRPADTQASRRHGSPHGQRAVCNTTWTYHPSASVLYMARRAKECRSGKSRCNAQCSSQFVDARLWVNRCNQEGTVHKQPQAKNEARGCVAAPAAGRHNKERQRANQPSTRAADSNTPPTAPSHPPPVTCFLPPAPVPRITTQPWRVTAPPPPSCTRGSASTSPAHAPACLHSNCAPHSLDTATAQQVTPPPPLYRLH